MGPGRFSDRVAHPSRPRPDPVFRIDPGPSGSLRESDPGRGCGGGFVAKALTDAGYEVAGVDLSHKALGAARDAKAGWFAVASGERLPFPDATFGAVACSEVLEHVNAPARFLTEIARVLRPDGTFLFSMPNRTWLSRLVLIKVGQGWGVTRVLPPHLHEWVRFIRPAELRQMMERRQLFTEDVVGLSVSTGAIPAVTSAYVRLKRRSIGYAEAGERIALRTGRIKAVAYLGHATLAPR